jgi:endonuclease/exonuclease/phosphatase family metal-dependent hydrolase
MFGLAFVWVALTLAHLGSPRGASAQEVVGPIPAERPWEVRPASTIRIATFNIALERREAGALTAELRSGESLPAKKLAEIIQRVRPDVLLLNEIDRDEDRANLELFHELYLQVPQNGQPAITFEHRVFPATNTGVDSGLDLNGNGLFGEPDDAYGFGRFAGQYAMAVLSRYPIMTDEIRTFQNFLWKDQPQARWPKLPNGSHYYPDSVREAFRLSSKNHVALPIKVPTGMFYFIVAHPTPPVFDGPEDRNGRRNHDEIRLLADLVNPETGSYLVDDQGRRGSLPSECRFVIAGDMNADPLDGDSTDRCIQQLLANPRVNAAMVPRSSGGVTAAKVQGLRNTQQQGDPSHDTADFNDESTGNLRVDYVLPSTNLECLGAGVFWPDPRLPESELATASDHRLVWIDIR